VFDLIGRHKYDHTLVEELSSYCDPSVDFPWYEPPFAELLANKLAGSGAMRQMAVLGVVTHHLYRTFLPPVELSKAWRYLGRRVVDLTANQHKVATAVIVMYKSVLEFLHPFHDGNGRFARVVATILLRRGGYDRTLINSENKILSVKEFFDLLMRQHSMPLVAPAMGGGAGGFTRSMGAGDTLAM